MADTLQQRLLALVADARQPGLRFETGDTWENIATDLADAIDQLLEQRMEGLTIYYVGVDEDDALGGLPFDSIESASSYCDDNGGLSIYSATAHVDADTVNLEADHSVKCMFCGCVLMEERDSTPGWVVPPTWIDDTGGDACPARDEHEHNDAEDGCCVHEPHTNTEEKSP